MNISVRRGREDILTLRGNFRVIHGLELDRLIGEDIEFFSTKSGLYEEWSLRRLGMPDTAEPADADRLIDGMEDGRRIGD